MKYKLQMKSGLYYMLLFFLLFLLSGCENPKGNLKKPAYEPVSKSSILLNTIVTITLYDSSDTSIIDDSFKLCRDYEEMFSRTIADSEIGRLNTAGTVKASADTLELMKAGIHYSELTSGAFDIAIAPLTSLWDFNSENPKVPDSSSVLEAVKHVDYQKINITGSKITLEDKKMGVDLGAIAKGYIADKIKYRLKESGVESAVINLGGNILCLGKRMDGTPFHIGIQLPFKDRNETAAIVEIEDKSVVSSGIYERYFEEDGSFYHHILNPDTGYPYDNNLSAVTIISEKSVDGDGLSTSCFALGLEKGMALIDSMDNVDAVFITKDNKLHYSKDFEKHIKIIE